MRCQILNICFTCRFGSQKAEGATTAATAASNKKPAPAGIVKSSLSEVKESLVLLTLEIVPSVWSGFPLQLALPQPFPRDG